MLYHSKDPISNLDLVVKIQDKNATARNLNASRKAQALVTRQKELKELTQNQVPLLESVHKQDNEDNPGKRVNFTKSSLLL
jgi:hypothetical protein